MPVTVTNILFFSPHFLAKRIFVRPYSDAITSFKRRKARYEYIKRFRINVMGTMAFRIVHDSRDTDIPFSHN